MSASLPEPELVALHVLRPHPQNYRDHPPDQLDHIEASLRQNGQYRNIVCASDWTILAGHGVVKTMTERLDWQEARAIRLPVEWDSPAALRILAGDNEIGRRAMPDDRALSLILKEIQDADAEGLAGTGYDEQMLANLLYVTRASNEIADFDAAAAWAGMPDFDTSGSGCRLMIVFESEAERAEFAATSHVTLRNAVPGRMAWTGVWPAKPKDDQSSVRFVQT